MKCITDRLDLVVIQIQFLQLLQLTKHLRVEKRHGVLSETQPPQMPREAVQSQWCERAQPSMHEFEFLYADCDRE